MEQTLCRCWVTRSIELVPVNSIPALPIPLDTYAESYSGRSKGTMLKIVFRSLRPRSEIDLGRSHSSTSKNSSLFPRSRVNEQACRAQKNRYFSNTSTDCSQFRRPDPEVRFLEELLGLVV